MTAKLYSESEIVFQEHLKSPKFKDITGIRYGRGVVLGFGGVSNGQKSLWFVRCDCGNIMKVQVSNLISRGSISCGCLNIEKTIERNTTHGLAKKGAKLPPEYAVWSSILARTQNPKTKNFKDYGGRGITVCERWLSFENFFEDMGERPGKEYSIERNNNNLGYSPDNCRWATKVEQNNNRRSNHPITHNGRTINLGQWADELGIKVSTIQCRLNIGWGINKALTTPVRPHKKYSNHKSGYNYR